MAGEFEPIPEEVVQIIRASSNAWEASGIQDPAQEQAFRKGFVSASMGGVAIEQTIVPSTHKEMVYGDPLAEVMTEDAERISDEIVGFRARTFWNNR